MWIIVNLWNSMKRHRLGDPAAFLHILTISSRFQSHPVSEGRTAWLFWIASSKAVPPQRSLKLGSARASKRKEMTWEIWTPIAHWTSLNYIELIGGGFCNRANHFGIMMDNGCRLQPSVGKMKLDVSKSCPQQPTTVHNSPQRSTTVHNGPQCLQNASELWNVGSLASSLPSDAARWRAVRRS